MIDWPDNYWTERNYEIFDRNDGQQLVFSFSLT